MRAERQDTQEGCGARVMFQEARRRAIRAQHARDQDELLREDEFDRPEEAQAARKKKIKELKQDRERERQKQREKERELLYGVE